MSLNRHTQAKQKCKHLEIITNLFCFLLVGNSLLYKDMKKTEFRKLANSPYRFSTPYLSILTLTIIFSKSTINMKFVFKYVKQCI